MIQLQKILAEVYGQDTSRLLIELLAAESQPMRYAEARRRINAHPQKFQRSVESLESLALIGRVLNPIGANRYHVSLEATPTGKRAKDIFDVLENSLHKAGKLATEIEFPKGLDEGAQAEG